MEFLQDLVEFVLHLDRHLLDLCTAYGTWVYAIIFAIIFCETGLVVTPILPGDSLLFAVGSLTAIGALDLPTSMIVLALAAVLGDTVNYWIGDYVGPKVFHQEHGWLLNKEYLLRTHRFYERHGGKTIVIARFLPIIRTFAPFVAGIGTMRYRRFLLFNVTGGILWVCVIVLAGHFFGSIPAIKNNFSLVIIALVLIPGIPSLVEFVRIQIQRRKSKAASSGDSGPPHS
jgi:membrane-associated protein